MNLRKGPLPAAATCCSMGMLLGISCYLQLHFIVLFALCYRALSDLLPAVPAGQ